MSKPRQQGNTPPQLQSAIEHHQAGRLQQAEAIYRKLPNNADALNLLGVIAYQTGRHEQAVESIRKAIRANPANATYHYNLGLSYRALDRIDDARTCYQKAVAINPRYIDAHNNLGVVLRELGQLDAAVKCYHKVISLDPDYVEAYSNLGATFKDQGNFVEAVAYCRRALERNPDHVGALGNLGAALNALNLHDEAIACSHRALALDPHCADAHNNLGAALKEQGKLDDAAISYRAALALRPDWSVLHFNLGSLLATEGKADEAAACFSQALQIAPEFADASNSLGAVLLGQAKLQQATSLFQHALQSAPTRGKALNNMGNALLYGGKLDEAIATFEQALHDGADPHITFSNLLFSHNYHPTLAAEAIFAVYQRWNEQFAVPLANYLPAPQNRADPAARLKIGYLSGDFRNHSVIHFAAPLIEHHDHERVEIFCYHNSFSTDFQTRRIMAAADHWIPCRAMGDDELAERIRADGIDVLVDLSGHTLGNRLLVFARKPAPVQVSWMGFGYTTGLSAMDYFIGDALFTPPGSESLFSETVYRLPCASWAYQPHAQAPEPGPLPARRRGYVTFCCVSTTTRIHAPLVAAWAAILLRLPEARLRLDTGMFRDAGVRRDFEDRFAALGVPAERLEIGFTSPVWKVYQDVDIVLDCFPHNSGTTTFEALWMGLPVVSLADRPSVGRFGASILAAIDKQEWVATDQADYVERAVALAQDVAGLELARASLRESMRSSSLLDHPGFARSMEAAYRDMWQHWCSAQSGAAPISIQDAIEHHRAGRLQEAETIYAAMPDNPDALHLLGVIASQSGDHSLAVERITRAIDINPGQAGYHCNLGAAYQALNRLDDAIASYRRALTLDPDSALALNNLGNALNDMDRCDEAITSLRQALAVQPDYVDAHSNLGNVLKGLGRNDEAIVCYQQAIALRPDFAEAHFNLGNAFSAQLKFNAAIDSFLQALAIKPDLHWAHNNLGLVLKDIGKLDDALTCFENALAIDPDFVNANSNLLYCANYHPTLSAERIFAAYQQWNARQAERFSDQFPSFTNQRDPGRRLKIGYVSADFRNHSVIHFAAPLIEHHDKSQVEVFCYYNQSAHDAFTERMVAASDHWIPCLALSDDELAQRIRDDGIDVLIDVSGHTLGNRLLAFARKPAPVQVSWLGFGCTTGLSAMDYFIGDARFTPPGSEALFSESVYRLPCAPWSYQPQAAAPLPGPLPARARGYVTFACVSATLRINSGLIEAWAAILHRLPEAHLRLDMRNFGDPDLRQEFEQKFAALGVPASQLEIGFTSPVWQVYQDVDIVLDCFPHNSGTTTFEALWMGLPVVSLADRPSVGRFGAAILTAIGRPEWIATSPADYIERAVALAQDVAGLELARASLRGSMRASSLLDHPAFARNMEAAYRDMWQQWCSAQPGGSPLSLQDAIERHRAGRLQEAEAIYAAMPDNPDALHLLGVIASQSGDNPLAVERITRAIAINPGQAGYYCNLGAAYQALNQFDDAIASYRQALTLNPDYALALNNLGNALNDTGRPEEAIASFGKALAIEPDYADAHSNLGSLFKKLGRNDEAVASYRKALAINPSLAEAHFNLGNALSNIGKLDDALACFENALTINPDFVDAYSNLLFCVIFHPTLSAERIFEAYQQWNARQAARFAGHLRPFANPRDPGRRLKIGYVSADFKNHSVFHFAGPLIEHHDKSQVEVFCYYNQSTHDAFTERAIAASDHWIACLAMSDDELAQRIRDDGIDVLIDLSGHTLGNRLLVFARKPAPVQLSWLGFGCTTGLSAMDYFIGDALFTPPGSEALFSETVYRLPRAPWAYQPQADAAPGPSPARARGYVTFACLSATVRINSVLIEAWAAILRRLPEAHLRLDMRNFRDPGLRLEFEQKFAALGVPASQLEIGFTSPVWQVYQEVDIVLDCFPHNSGTTTFEALWMGLPVVTLADRPSVGRFGASILTAIGKPEWIATSRDDYIERAVALAKDVAGLERIRAALRDTMRGSPLLDHAGFARDMEAAYRDMWQQWCSDSGAEEIVD